MTASAAPDHLPFELPAQLSGYLSPSSAGLSGGGGGSSSGGDDDSPPPPSDSDSGGPAAPTTTRSSSSSSGSPLPPPPPRPGAYITDLGPHDICCGRGTTCNENPGNVSFRTVVAGRRLDYVATKSRKAKGRIARELLRQIRGLDPPGRFLTRVDGREARRAAAGGQLAGCPSASASASAREVWKVAGDDIALEKIKQSLRRSERGGDSGGGGGKEATAPSPPAPAVSVSVPSPPPQSIAAASTGGAASAESPLREWLWSRRWNSSTRSEREANMVTRVQVAHGVAVAAKKETGGGGGGSGTGSGMTTAAASFDTNSVLIREGNDGFQVRIDRSAASGGPSAASLPAHGEQSEVQVLLSLGRALLELFGGGASLSSLPRNGASSISGGSAIASASDAEGGYMDEGGSRKKRSTTTVTPSLNEDLCVDLRELGLPMSLCTVVTSLLRANDAAYPERYSSVDELMGDLDLLRTRPSRYLFDDDTVVPHLEFLDTRQGRLYGREEELGRMQAVLDRASQPGCRSEVLLLRGFSGVGKSFLVHALAKRVGRDPKGVYLSGKFNDRQSAPLSALSSAFDGYILSLLIEAGENDSKKATLTAIRSAVGFGDGMILAELIPSLRLINAPGDDGDDAADATDKGISSVQSSSDALNRLVFFFQKLVRAISSINTLVLAIDDLQWADSASLELLYMFATDSEASLLIIGGYRDNEVSPDHPLTTSVQKLEAAMVNVENIDVQPLPLGPTNEMLSDMLHLLPRLTMSLSAIVHRKTLGNSLFALRFLSTLFDDGFLCYSPRSRQWTWDVSAINRISVADDLVSLLVRKLSHLPIELQRLLCLASSLGHQFEESIVAHICVEDSMRSSAETLLDIAEEEGFVYKAGSAYCFAHDQIQSAIYSMCAPENVDGCLHLMIGKVLLSSCSNEEIEKNLFTIADQIILGKQGLIDRNEKIEMAHLHLRAGKKAMTAAGFVSATQYLTGALSLMDESGWACDYDLSLQIYSANAESNYAIGNFDEVQRMAEAVLLHGKCLSDQLRVYRSYIQALGSESKLNEAISVSTHVLGQMGVIIPAEVNDAVIGAAMMEVQGLLAVTPPESIVALNELTDQNMIFVLRILTLMTTFAYFGGRKDLFPIITAHMVRISLTKGVCSESALAFSSFAMILSGVMNDYPAAYGFGKLANGLLQRFDARECTARLYGAILNGVNVWIEPLQSVLPTALLAYEQGMSTGDLYFAILNLHGYINMSFQCCKSLKVLVDESKVHLETMRHNKQDLLYFQTVPIRQAALNLMGLSKDPLILSGEAMEEESFMSEVTEKSAVNAVCIANTMKMILAFLFDDLDLAVNLADTTSNIDEVLMAQFLVCTHKLYAGLIHTSMFKRTRDLSWRKKAEMSIKKMRVWANAGPWNCEHRCNLLEAELLCADEGINEETIRLYNAAIEGSGKNGFASDHALALERAGHAFSASAANNGISIDFFRRAEVSYRQWSANAKADALLRTQLM